MSEVPACESISVHWYSYMYMPCTYPLFQCQSSSSWFNGKNIRLYSNPAEYLGSSPSLELKYLFLYGIIQKADAVIVLLQGPRYLIISGAMISGICYFFVGPAHFITQP